MPARSSMPGDTPTARHAAYEMPSLSLEDLTAAMCARKNSAVVTARR